MFCGMPNLPTCPNHLEGSCDRSDVYVSKETDSAYVIFCKTCRSANVWPKKNDEDAGRYSSFLKHKAARAAQERHELSRPAFSYANQTRKY